MIAEIAKEDIPKEGITAGDLKMANQAEPIPSELPNAAVSFPEAVMVEFKNLSKRLDQQGELLIQLADKVIAPQNQIQTTGQPVTIMGVPVGNIGDLIQAIRGALGAGGGGDDLYSRIGKQVVDGTIQSTVSRIIKSSAGEAAKHVTG
jgi:hypothetical protein